MCDSNEIRRYSNKKFSVMGDSISTLQGFNPDTYDVFYTAQRCEDAGIKGPEDTWWGKVIADLGGELAVNNAYSGSWVAKLPDREGLFYSGCSDERTSFLDKDGVSPDVIIIYLGTNDWYYGASPECKVDIQILKDQSFRYAYNSMLEKIKRNYPEAELWCCTLCISDFGEGEGGFPFERRGVHMKEYCDIIRELSRKHGCRLIDLYSYMKPYHSVDGFHPSVRGMETIAQMVLDEVKNVRDKYEGIVS